MGFQDLTAEQRHAGAIKGSRKGQTRNTYDWVLIKQYYVMGTLIKDEDTGISRHVFPSLSDCTTKFGVDRGTVGVRSSKENWMLERNMFKAKMKDRREMGYVKDLLNESSSFDNEHLAKVKQIHKLLDYYLIPYAHILDGSANQDGLGMDRDEDLPPLSMTDLDKFVTVLTKAHNLSRSILGDPISSTDLHNEMKEMASTGNATLDAEARKRRIDKLSKKRDGRDGELAKLQEEQKAIVERIRGVNVDEDE